MGCSQLVRVQSLLPGTRERTTPGHSIIHGHPLVFCTVWCCEHLKSLHYYSTSTWWEPGTAVLWNTWLHPQPPMPLLTTPSHSLAQQDIFCNCEFQSFLQKFRAEEAKVWCLLLSHICLSAPFCLLTAVCEQQWLKMAISHWPRNSVICTSLEAAKTHRI